MVKVVVLDVDGTLMDTNTCTQRRGRGHSRGLAIGCQGSETTKQVGKDAGHDTGVR